MCPAPAAVVGAVHPAGTTSVNIEFAGKLLLLPGSLFVNVNWNVLPLLPAGTAVGDTVIVPSPLLAPASVNVFCTTYPDWLPTALSQNRTLRSCVSVTKLLSEMFPLPSATTV